MTFEYFYIIVCGVWLFFFIVNVNDHNLLKSSFFFDIKIVLISCYIFWSTILNKLIHKSQQQAEYFFPVFIKIPQPILLIEETTWKLLFKLRAFSLKSLIPLRFIWKLVWFTFKYSPRVLFYYCWWTSTRQ